MQPDPVSMLYYHWWKKDKNKDPCDRGAYGLQSNSCGMSRDGWVIILPKQANFVGEYGVTTQKRLRRSVCSSISAP